MSKEMFCPKCKSKVIPILVPESKFEEEGRFKKLKDGWIKDNLLDLDWSESSKEEMDWEKAEKWCTELNGRLPSTKELVSIARCEFFDSKEGYYWSATEYSASFAWLVRFSDGTVYGNNKTNSYYVRAVRASQ